MQLAWVPQAQGLIKLLAGLQSSEGLHGAGTSASRKAHRGHGGPPQSLTGCQL